MSARWQWRRPVPVSGHTMTSPSLREVHERLVRLGSAPVSDADAGWQDLRRKLPDRPLSWSGRLMAWLRRPAIAMMTTGLLSTGVAHAAGVQPVRGGVDWLVGGVNSIVRAKNEPRLEREARPGQGESALRVGAGSFEENRRRISDAAGVESDPQEREPGGAGRGLAPAPGGAGSGDDEDRDERRDDDRDQREREDDDGDELEDREDIDEEARFEPDDDEAEELDDEELEEPDDQSIDAERDEDEREELESDAYDEVDPEEDRG